MVLTPGPLGVSRFFDFGPTDTPGPTPSPTLTSTPDADGHLPNPQATIATRTYPGDHFPTAVAFVQGLVAGTPDATKVHSAVPNLAEIWAPRLGPSRGMMVTADDIVTLLQNASVSPYATPMVQGYFLGHWGTPAPTPDPDMETIAVVVTFLGDGQPFPYPTDGRWFDPTAQAIRPRWAGHDVGVDPLVFVLVVTSDSYRLVRIIDNYDGYDNLVRRMQEMGFGPYYSFRP